MKLRLFLRKDVEIFKKLFENSKFRFKIKIYCTEKTKGIAEGILLSKIYC